MKSLNALVISDSHGDAKAVKTLINNLSSVINAVIFLGDHNTDILPLARANHKKLLYHIVNGNNDYQMAEFGERVIDFGGVKIFITHGHRYGSEDRLAYKALELGVIAVCFGHTHVGYCGEVNGVSLINPGSLRLPRNGASRSYAILRAENGRLNYKLAKL